MTNFFSLSLRLFLASHIKSSTLNPHEQIRHAARSTIGITTAAAALTFPKYGSSMWATATAACRGWDLERAA